MINLSDIKQKDLNSLAGMYAFGKWTLCKDPAAATDGELAKLRKKMGRESLRIYDLPEELCSYFEPTVPIRELFGFLADCEKEYTRRRREKKENTKALLALFGTEVARAVSYLQDLDWYINIKITDGNAAIKVTDTTAISCTLHLTGLTSPDRELGVWDGDCKALEDGRFSIYGTGYDYETEEDVEFDLSFTGAHVTAKVFDCAHTMAFCDSPWDILYARCALIMDKAQLGPDYLNEKEKDLLPLIEEIGNLEPTKAPVEGDHYKYPLLKKLCADRGFGEIAELICKQEEAFYGSKAFNRGQTKLKAVLSKEKYYPLWKELFSPINEAQRGYPKKADFYCKEEIDKTRQDLTTILRQYGYEGSYPGFSKTAPMKGLHLARSYNMTYFVGLKRKVKYYIHCSELYNYDNKQLFFVSAADLRKKGQGEDIYSCLFDSKGHTFSATTDHNPILGHNLKQSVDIAVKRAEQKRLTKAEKEREGHPKPFATFVFLLIMFLIMGGLFATLFTLGMAAFTSVVGLIVDGTEGVKAIFSEWAPWLFMFFGSWVAFGGAMTLIEFFAKRK